MDWHWIFIMLIPVLVLSLALGLYAIRQAQPTVKVGFDVVGWLIIVLLSLAFNWIQQVSHDYHQPLIFVLGWWWPDWALWGSLSAHVERHNR
jgi:MFS transporter, DHA2 family, lincomycin resistance protein